jgi:hypothetical protein
MSYSDLASTTSTVREDIHSLGTHMTIRRSQRTVLACASLSFALLSLSISASAAGDTSSGFYRVNGKDAKLNYTMSRQGFCFKEGVEIVLSEKPVEEKDNNNSVGFSAQMEQFGDAVAVNLCVSHDKWIVDASNFSHASLRHAGGTWVDQLKIENMTLSNGEYSGHLVSIKDAKILEQPLELDLTFRVKQPASE